ncbi:MAG TPA: hypothetical protein VK475_02895 [Pyrinomonadaceae bacterium]|jgi:hypothetical protein|nr:hypothetical protein [Pyrinomonadaceae bacterium]
MKTKLLIALSAAGLSLAFAASANDPWNSRDRGGQDDQRDEARGHLVRDSNGRIVGEHFFITRGLMFGFGELVRVTHRGLTFTVPLSAAGFSVAPVPDNSGTIGADLPEVMFESADCTGQALVPQSPVNALRKNPVMPVSFLVGPLAVQVGEVVYVPGTFVDTPVVVGSVLNLDLRSGPVPQCLPIMGDLSGAAPFYKAIKINFSDLGFIPPFKLD